MTAFRERSQPAAGTVRSTAFTSRDTGVPAGPQCAACGAPLPGRDRAHGGRSARYCSGACKAKAYRARRNPGEPAGAGGPPLSAAVRHARAIEIRQQISQLAAILADTASGQQELFASPGTARAARPAETAQALHQLITELAALAAAMTVTKRVTLADAPAQVPQTAPLFGHPGNLQKGTS
jgi:hypothetical protein